jgi:uncharacterized membrane protein
MELLRAVYLFAGVMLVILGIPLAQRRIKPNIWYGFRMPQTLRDEHVWYETNAYFGVRFSIVGFVTIATALVLSLLPNMDEYRYAMGVTVVVVLGLAVTIILSFRHMRAVAR